MCFTPVGSGLTRKHWAWLDRLARSKQSRLLRKVINYGRKKTYNISTYCQYYKTFFRHWRRAKRLNKLEHFAPEKFFHSGLIFEIQPEPSWVEHHSGVPYLSSGPYTSLERLPRENTLAYLPSSSVMRAKKLFSSSPLLTKNKLERLCLASVLSLGSNL